jgi:hypothetical protein
MNKVLLIDLENCPCQINALMTHLENYSYVVVCYAKTGTKVPIDWIIPLTSTVNDSRLKIIKMPVTGKNAADFGITFWAGMLMAKLPQKTHFDIFSNDTDLDYLVGLLKSQQRTAERIGTKKEIPPILAKIANQVIKDDYLQESCLYLSSMINNKPTKKESLLNSIKSKFKSDNVDENILFDSLVKHSVITVNANKITYNQPKLMQLAKKQ